MREFAVPMFPLLVAAWVSLLGTKQLTSSAFVALVIVTGGLAVAMYRIDDVIAFTAKLSGFEARMKKVQKDV
jgi:hypothetical protein